MFWHLKNFDASWVNSHQSFTFSNKTWTVSVTTGISSAHRIITAVLFSLNLVILCVRDGPKFPAHGRASWRNCLQNWTKCATLKSVSCKSKRNSCERKHWTPWKLPRLDKVNKISRMHQTLLDTNPCIEVSDNFSQQITSFPDKHTANKLNLDHYFFEIMCPIA